jgi:hypothetical protein
MIAMVQQDPDGSEEKRIVIWNYTENEMASLERNQGQVMILVFEFQGRGRGAALVLKLRERRKA